MVKMVYFITVGKKRKRRKEIGRGIVKLKRKGRKEQGKEKNYLHLDCETWKAMDA